MFDLPPTVRGERVWEADLPLEGREWRIGAIVGPSGCGKSTLARELFGPALRDGFDWPVGRSLLDGFPAGMATKEIVGLLSSVGFSSPPAWLRPAGSLSTGELFRANLARGLAEALAEPRQGAEPPLLAVDEYTSVVDRTVARIGSAALAKAVPRLGLRFVAVTCHFDVLDWLQPDWTFEPATGAFQWRAVRPRPAVEIVVRRCRREWWRAFSHHHYLSSALAPAARCFLARVEGRPAAFVAVLPFPHPTRPGWREHRTVCLPDFQGIGIGNAVSEFVAGLYAATGRPYRSITSHPAMVRHRAKSPRWKMTRPPSQVGRSPMAGMRRSSAADRLTASFEFVGPSRAAEARRFGLLAG